MPNKLEADDLRRTTYTYMYFIKSKYIRMKLKNNT